MKPNFAIRLDQALSLLRPVVCVNGEPATVRPVTNEDVQACIAALIPLVKEAFEMEQ